MVSGPKDATAQRGDGHRKPERLAVKCASNGAGFARQLGMRSGVPIRGVWWRPEDPSDQVVGDLTVTADSPPSLELVGTLKSIEEFGGNWSTPLIHGQPVNGQPITLVSCHEMKWSINAPGTATQTLAAFGGVVVGLHIDPPDALVFDRIVVEVEHLGELVGRTGLAVVPDAGDGRVQEVTVRCEVPTPLSVRLASD